MITPEDYFAAYADHEDITDKVRDAAAGLLAKVNEVYALAAADGCEMQVNPSTNTEVSGTGNGGFRPRDCKVGASDSTHKDGRGVDKYDPDRKFASWCLAHLRVLKERNLHMENPCWTPTWVHLQDAAPRRSGNTVYVPSAAPALARLPTEWNALA